MLTVSERPHYSDEQNGIETKPTPILWPSSLPSILNSRIIGVGVGTVQSPEVHSSEKPQSISEEYLALCGDVLSTEVYRTAAQCAEQKCVHFNHSRCCLASRILQIL